MSLGCGGKRWPWKVDSFVENLVDFFGTLFWFLDESWNSWKISGSRGIFFECWGVGTRSRRRRRQQWLRQHILGLAAQPDPISPQLTRIGWKITDRQILAREGQQLQDKTFITAIQELVWFYEQMNDHWYGSTALSVRKNTKFPHSAYRQVKSSILLLHNFFGLLWATNF